MAWQENQPSKQENHTCSLVYSSISKKKHRAKDPFQAAPRKARERPSRKSWMWNIIVGPVIWSLSCFVLAAVVLITAPLSSNQCRLSFLANVSFLVRLHSEIRWFSELKDSKTRAVLLVNNYLHILGWCFANQKSWGLVFHVEYRILWRVDIEDLWF